MPGYSDEIYDFIVSQDSSFKDDKSREDFNQDIKDRNYSNKIFSYISDLDESFKNDYDEDSFYADVSETVIEEKSIKEPTKEEGINRESLANKYDLIINQFEDKKFKPELVGDAREKAINDIKSKKEQALKDFDSDSDIASFADRIYKLGKKYALTQDDIDATKVSLEDKWSIMPDEVEEETTELDMFGRPMPGSVEQESTVDLKTINTPAIESARLQEHGDDLNNYKKEAVRQGYTVVGAYEEAPENIDKNKLIKLPGPLENPNISEIYPESVINNVLNDKRTQVARDQKVRDMKPELDAILEEFEEEKGVTAVGGHILGTIMEAGDSFNNLFLDEKSRERQEKISLELHKAIGTDASYMDAREKLNRLLASKQDTENYEIDVNTYRIEAANDNLQLLEHQLLNYEKRANNGETFTEQDVAEYNVVKSAYNKQIDIANEAMLRLGELTVEGVNFDEIKDKTLKTYSTLSVYGNNIGSSVVRIAGGLATLRHELTVPQLARWAGYDINDAEVRSEIASGFDDFFGTEIGDEIEAGLSLINDGNQEVKQQIGKLHSWAEEIKDENREKQDFNKITNPLEFVAWGFEGVTENAVNLAVSAATGGSGGLVLMALSEAGNKMNEMNKEMEGEKWSDDELKFIQKEKDRLGNNYSLFYPDQDDEFKIKPKNVSALQYFGTAGLYGASEYVTEKITLTNFKFAKNNIKKAWNLGGETTDEVGGRIINSKLNPLTKAENFNIWGKEALKGTFNEAGGEGIVTMSQNFADRYFLDKYDVSLLDGVTESMAMGAFMNGTMQSPVLLSQAANAFRPESQNALVAKTGAEILSLSKQRDKIDAQIFALKGSDPAAIEKLKNQRNEIQDNIMDLSTKQLENMRETESTIASLTKSDRQSLIDVFNNEHKVRKEIDDINENESLSKADKKSLINTRLDYLTKQNAKKQRILTNRVFEADKERGRNFATAWRTENNLLDDVANIQGNNNKEALEKGLQHVDTIEDLTDQEKNQVKDQMKNEFKRVEQESSGDYTVHGMAFGDNLTVETVNPDGTKTTRKVNVPINFAMGKRNRTVQSHEMGHQTVFKKFMQNNSNAVGLVSDMESYIKKNFKGEILQELKEVEEAYKDRSKAEIAEEKLARISDFLRKKNIKGDRTLRNKLFGRFQKLNEGNGQINTGKDVFDMITSYNQSFETGVLSGLAKTVAQQDSKSKPTTAKRSMTKAEQDKVEDNLNEAPGVRNKDGKYTMTKAEWRADKNRAFSKAYNMLMNGDLDGLIIAKMASGKDIFGQAREDFINDARDKIGQHMLNFDPQMQDSLFGWVNSYISRKVGDVARKAKREKAKTPGSKISTDQKLSEEGRTVAETIEGDTATDIEAAVDRSLKAKKKGIDNLRTRLGIEKGGNIYNKVVDSVKKVFGSKLPEVSNKNFKEALKKDFNTLLFKDIKNDIGTRAKYKEFIEGDVTFKDADGNTKTMPRWEMLYDYISQSTFNKRFEPFIEPLIDPATGKQARPDNNPLFTKKKITKQQWVDYFLGDNVQASTKGTRKDALASAIAQELAFDATMETISDPAIQARIRDIYESQGLRQAENYLEQVAKEIDREPSSKFSKTRDITRKNEINNLRDFLSSPEILEAVQEGRNLEGFINDFVSKLDSVEPIIKEINELRRIARRFRDQQEAVLENLDDIINQNVDLSAQEKKAIIAEAKRKVKASKKTIEISDAVREIAERLKLKDGFAYEQAVYDEINKAIKEFNIEGFKLSDGPTEVEGAADLVSTLFDQEFNVELKLEKPRYSSVTLKYELNKLAPSILKNYPFNDRLIKMAQDKKEAFKKYRDRANELGEQMFGKDYIPMDQMGDALPKEIFEQLKREGLQKGITSEVMASTDIVSKLYWAKKNGTAYIQIKGKGLYYLPNTDNSSLENPLRLDVPPFEGEVMISMAVSKNSIKSKKGPKRYLNAGVKLVNGKLPGSTGFVSAGMRFQMTNLRNLPDSNVNLDNAKSIKKLMDSSSVAIIKEQQTALKQNDSMFSKSKVVAKSESIEEQIRKAEMLDKALNVARDPNAPVRKIRVFDFDDTLARTNSLVLYEMPDGSTGKLTAEEFAKRGDSILAEGGTFDFSDFNNVRDGKPGPLLEVAKKIQEARGTKDVFVLTARPAESAVAIKEFLDAVGLNIPLKNITGLADSSPLAKSEWIISKAADGYNDFYFADDHLGNVDSVKTALSVIDVKSNVQQAKAKFSKTVDKTINDIIEHKTGIKSESEYSDVKARLKGRKKGRFEIFIPPSAEDFVGLLYKMIGKGEIGNMQMDWFKEHLIEPYGRAMENLSRDQNRMINDFKALKEVLVKQGVIPKNLNKKAFGEYTVQNVARILAWDKQGFDIPGLSKTDLKQVLDYAKKNPAIDVFAQNLIDINKGDGYAAPNADWLGGTISTDLLDGLRTGKRSKYLQQWQENVDIIFSPKNLNKMEAAFGTKYREAMEDMLSRMKSGRNRSNNMGRLENRLLDYINNSVGTVMFFNMRSALLQTISAINFIDFGSNNVFRAAKAFANQKQYWTDFMELMNSEFLVERRNGLKLNVSESEIADAAATSKNKAKAAVAYILQKGYLPTQFADSFAIASGGATFYRNRINALMKEGMSEADAKKQAFLEFREIAEESQQSSRPDRVSQQQASVLGRLILAFQNTPMQMNRLGKKAFLDLVNRRKRTGMTQFQSDMSNASRITYYFAVQSVIFNALQQALFALAFNDDEEESEKERYYNIANGMLNTFLNGTGMIGVAASTLISVGRKVYKESAKEGQFPGPNYEDAANEMLNFSPPIDIKLSKLRQAGLTWKYEGYKHDEAKWGIDDPAYKSAAYVISGLTNVPLDRLISKSENVRSAIEDEQQTWKRISLLLGWRDYQLNSTEERKEYVTSQKEAKKRYREKMKNKGVRQYSPKTLEEQKIQSETIKYTKLNKARQVEMLDSLGLSKKQIKNLKYEKDRVKKLIELMK